MIKKYFNDGLLQLAILLSLLRTDLNNYLNIHLHNSQGEIHEIILGPTSAYTQINFHSNHWNSDLGFSHPKNVENDHPSILEELHSLGNFNSIPHDTSIAAWLVNQPPVTINGQEQVETENPPAGEAAEVSDENSHDEPGDSPEEVGATSSSPDEGPSVNTLGELTREDLDLIDILWRQDMDLGIGRDVFDAALRRDLEKEKEMEEAKQREKEKQEAMQKAQEASYSLINHTYVRDNETGELLPVPTDGEENYEQMAPPINILPEVETEPVDWNAIMRLLEQQVEESEDVNAEPTVSLPQLPYNLSEQSYQTIIDSTQSSLSMPITAPSVPLETETMAEPPLMMRQTSLEQALEEMSSMFHLSSPEETMLPNSAMGNSTYPALTACNDTFDDSSTPLIHNTTLAPPLESNVNLTHPLTTPTLDDLMDLNSISVDSLPVDDTLLFGGALVTPPDVTGTAVFPMDAINTTTPSMSQPSALASPGAQSSASTSSYGSADSSSLSNHDRKTPACGSTSSSSGKSDYFSSGSFLDMLVDQNDDAFEDMDLSDLESKPRQHADDASSDSAVSSMGSIASPTPNYQDMIETGSNFSDQLSLFDGMEGATGGSEGPVYKVEPKTEKYFHNYELNQSGEYMDTSSNFSDHYESSYTLANKKHVKHNHTYPLQPGQQPRERKVDKKASDMKLHLGRDVKRAKELRIPFTPEEIIHSNVERFNEMLQRVGLTEAQQQLIRDIRRRGKNKVAAQNCRKRKLDVISTLDEEVDGMKHERETLNKQLQVARKELDEYQAKMDVLYKEVFSSLRDDSGRPYDPDQYSLEQGADGNIFLMPRNVTEGRHKKDGKKHKGKRSK